MPQKNIFCLGFFDGVHLGHRAILTKGVELAKKLRGRVVAVTFDKHPMSIITGINTPMIDSFERRVRLLGEIEGISAVEVIEFTKELSGMDWRDFFDLLLRCGPVAGIAVGFDYSFGAGGRGRAEDLARVCAERGIACEIVPAVKTGCKKISSSLIRELVSSGKIEEARELLGRPFELEGRAEEGRHIARTLGFPTINTRLGAGIVQPKFGVYLSCCSLGGEFHAAITNIGRRPTIPDGGTAVETHLLFTDPGTAYGKKVNLRLIEYLRGERRFECREQLTQQVQEDILKARKRLLEHTNQKTGGRIYGL